MLDRVHFILAALRVVGHVPIWHGLAVFGASRKVWNLHSFVWACLNP